MFELLAAAARAWLVAPDRVRCSSVIYRLVPVCLAELALVVIDGLLDLIWSETTVPSWDLACDVHK
jgi:hypothetical protein